MKANNWKTVQGTVEATAQNAPNRFGVKIADKWFDGFGGQGPVQKGDEVEVAYVERGEFKNVKRIKVADVEDENDADTATEEIRGPTVSRINRAVALKCAARVVGARGGDGKSVIETARRFEEWLRAV